MKHLSPEDRVLLRKGNCQLRILLAVTIAAFWGASLAYELYLEVKPSANLIKKESPEGATSGPIHNN